MEDFTRARALVLNYYGDDYSATDDNIMDCYRWLLDASISKECASEAISAETGIILNKGEL